MFDDIRNRRPRSFALGSCRIHDAGRERVVDRVDFLIEEHRETSSEDTQAGADGFHAKGQRRVSIAVDREQGEVAAFADTENARWCGIVRSVEEDID